MEVHIVEDTTNGNPARTEVSAVKIYSIPMSGLAINSIDYDPMVEKQIQVQQAAVMQVQTAIANSKKAEQDAITVELQGKASAAEAKWKQEVIKAQLVTEAESNLAVQELATKQAKLYKQQQILEGEGDAAKKRLVMQADGALTQKLDAWKEERKYAWDAFGKYQGDMVPQIQTLNGGGKGGKASSATDFIEIMGIKAAQDLSLSFKTK